jgi:AcrR family transcriptional regulator
MKMVRDQNTVKKKQKVGRVYAGLSSERRQRERREILLDAASQIIGDQGYKSATVRAVCNKAKLSNRYYYEAFSNSEDMLISVYRRQVQALQTKLSNVLLTDNAKPEHILETAFSLAFTEFKNNSAMAKILFIEVIGVSSKVDKELRVETKNFVDMCLGFLRPLYIDDLPHHYNDQIVINSLVGAMIHTCNLWILADFDYTVKELTLNMTFMSKSVMNALGIETR